MEYKEIKLFEVGLTARSGDGLKVKFDLEKQLISWSDGYMWSNNFMRSINNERLRMLAVKLPATGMLEWIEAYNNGEEEIVGYRTANPSTWKIEVVSYEGLRVSACATQNFPKNWSKLKEIIEEATECTFRLR